MIIPSMSQLINQTQLLFDIPVSRYIQVITPINGIREYFLMNAKIARSTALSQNMIKEILGVAASIKLIFPAVRSSLALKSKLNMSVK